MKTANRVPKPKPEQLTMFERRPVRTSWNVVPLHVRRAVVELLAKILVEHRERVRSAKGEGGEEQ
jgi:hypothetical protein